MKTYLLHLSCACAAGTLSVQDIIYCRMEVFGIFPSIIFFVIQMFPFILPVLPLILVTVWCVLQLAVAVTLIIMKALFVFLFYPPGVFFSFMQTFLLVILLQFFSLFSKCVLELLVAVSLSLP